MKLRILVDKVRADFLKDVKTRISIELTKHPVTMTYKRLLMSFRNEVNCWNLPQMTSNIQTKMNIRELNQGRKFSGRWKAHRGRGYCSRGRGGRETFKGTTTNSSFITLTDGTTIKYHHPLISLGMCSPR